MRKSRRQKHIKQLLRITLRLSRKLRQLARSASALPHERTASNVPRHQHATRWTRCMSTSRYPRGHVQLSRAPRTWARTWWCAMLCSVCGGGGALAGGSWARLVKWGGVVPMFQCFRHVIRHRQTHFHKAQHTRRCICISYPICGEQVFV